MSEFTRILLAIEAGNARAAGQLLPLVYDELCKLAAAQMARENPGQTLDATALVHEAWLRLVGPDGDAQFDNRGHFFAAAAEAMRRILVDNARRKARLKHGGAAQRVELTDPPAPQPIDNLAALDDALNRLAVDDQLAAKVVELRYFA